MNKVKETKFDDFLSKKFQRKNKKVDAKEIKKIMQCSSDTIK